MPGTPEGYRHLDGRQAFFGRPHVGHGLGRDLARRWAADAGGGAARRIHELEGHAHRRAIEPGRRVPVRLCDAGRPQPATSSTFGRVGSKPVVLKLGASDDYLDLAGQGEKRHKADRAQGIAYHGTTLGRRPPRRRGSPASPHAVRAAGAVLLRPTPITNEYLLAAGAGRPAWAADHRGADRVRGARDRRGGDPRAGAERRRLLHAAEGYFQRVREICDRHGVLLVSDEVICSWGRPGPGSAASATTMGRTSSRREGPDVGVRADGRGDRLLT